MGARKRLMLERLENRDLFAVAEFTTRLFADDSGTPGDLLTNDQVEVGDSFFVEILAREFHPRTGGLASVALDVSWNPESLELLDENPADTVTEDLPLSQSGTLDAVAGTITNLAGSTFLASNVGRAIGNVRPERFALLHFEAIAASDATSIAMREGASDISTVPVMSLGRKDLNFVAPQIQIVSPAEIPDTSVIVPPDDNDVSVVDDSPAEDPAIINDSLAATTDEVFADEEIVSDEITLLPDTTDELTSEPVHIFALNVPRTPHGGQVVNVAPELFAVAIPKIPSRELRSVLHSLPKVPVHKVLNRIPHAIPAVPKVTAKVEKLVPPAKTAAHDLKTKVKEKAKQPAITAAVDSGIQAANHVVKSVTTAAPKPAQVRTALAALPTSPLVAALGSGWKRITNHAKRPFDWSTFVVLLSLCLSSSFAFAQGPGREAMEEAAQRRARLRAGVLHRPMPPIKSSTSATPSAALQDNNVRLAYATESRPEENVGSGVNRRVNYQQANPEELGIELPAELQNEGMVYEESGNYSESGRPFMNGMQGYFGGGNSNRNCGPIWARAEYLLWWMEGFSTPPLVTTSAAGTARTNAGILGLASTSVLYGNDSLEEQSRSGGRFTLGGWFDQDNTIGVQASYFGLQNQGNDFAANSPSTGIIARPFFNVEPGFEGNDAELIAYPGLFIGSINVNSTSSLQGLELLTRATIAQNYGWRVDGLLGYRYQRLKEGVTISDNRTVIGTGTGLAVGTTFEEFDRFNSSNEFHGGDVGFVAGYTGQAFSLEGTLKLAIGVNKQSVNIAGQSTTSVPVANGNPQIVTTNAGLLAQASNIGTYHNSEFAVIPEVGATVGYKFTPRLRGTVGYTFMYWTDVVRPGAQIDPDLNLSQLAVGGLNGLARPQFRQVTENLWIQGVNVGLDYSF